MAAVLSARKENPLIAGGAAGASSAIVGMILSSSTIAGGAGVSIAGAGVVVIAFMKSKPDEDTTAGVESRASGGVTSNEGSMVVVVAAAAAAPVVLTRHRLSVAAVAVAVAVGSDTTAEQGAATQELENTTGRDVLRAVAVMPTSCHRLLLLLLLLMTLMLSMTLMLFVRIDLVVLGFFLHQLGELDPVHVHDSVVIRRIAANQGCRQGGSRRRGFLLGNDSRVGLGHFFF
mmetsp:Transcript_5001/g.14499  ORF Transcript_5001/g.14499 Transcript_5001/m.14499 type:complete len:231 (-) Transcript_5001:182-874(-)